MMTKPELDSCSRRVTEMRAKREMRQQLEREVGNKTASKKAKAQAAIDELKRVSVAVGLMDADLVIPPGWQLVPVEMTPAMFEAMARAVGPFKAMWSAALKAAPKPGE